MRCHKSPSAFRWIGSAIGNHRAWVIIDGLDSAGLLQVKRGYGSKDGNGFPSCLWPTEAFVALAYAAGVTAETAKADWAVNPLEEACPARILRRQLVTIDDPIGHQDGVTEPLAAQMEAFNGALSIACIRGAGPRLGLARRFGRTLDFGGRIYAVGGGSYQTLSQQERLGITFHDGEQPSVEVDVKASQLTVLLGLTGLPLSKDPYAFPDLPRPVVKEWMVQTMGRGKGTWTTWGEDTGKGVKGFRPRDIWATVRTRYPFLEDLSHLVPTEALARVPEEDHGWAAGQWIVAQEAACMVSAMDRCIASGIPALPVHDSLIVPAGRLEEVQEALQGAFAAGAGITPRLDVRRQ